MDENTATVVLMLGFFVYLGGLLWWCSRTPSWMSGLEDEWREHLSELRKRQDDGDDSEDDAP